MSHEASEHPEAAPPRLEPSDVVRERVLQACRREMARRVAQERRTRLRRWSMATGVALLLAVNALEELRMTARIETLVQGPGVVASAPRPTTALIAAWHARVGLLATLLRDPHAL